MTYRARGMMRERLHAEVALNTALEHGVFSENIPQTIFLPTAEKAHTEDLKKFQAWEEQLKTLCRREAKGGGPAIFPNVDGAAPAPSINNKQARVEAQDKDGTVQRSTVPQPKRALLKGEQQCTHNIIEGQLLKRIAGKFQAENLLETKYSPKNQGKIHNSSECWSWDTEEPAS